MSLIIYVKTYGEPGATYDPETGYFLIAWPSQSLHAIQWVTMRSARLPGDAPQAFGALNNYTRHAPSIACREYDPEFAGIPRCVIVYEHLRPGDSMPPCLRWVETEPDPLTGELVDGTTHTQCDILFDSPSVVWHRTDKRFYLAFQQDNERLFVKTLTPGDRTWDSVHSLAQGGYYSSPTLTVEFGGFFPGGAGEARMFGWYLHYPEEE